MAAFSGRPVRVVYLDHVAQLSGGELALLRLLSLASNLEAHVILAESGPLVERLRSAGIRVEVMPLRRRTAQLRKDRIRSGRLPWSAVWDTLIYTLRLSRRLRALRPDVVHTNSLKAGVYGSLAARLARLPVVWHVRDRIDSDYLPALAVVLVRALIRWLPHVVVANSRATLATTHRRRRALVIASIPAGSPAPDPARPPRQAPNAPGQRTPGAPGQQARLLTIAILGRLAPWKGQDVFLRAFARAFPSGGHRALVIGAPLFGAEEDAYAAELRRLVGELGLDGRVAFLGHREDVAAELAQLDILVHASTLPEPFGQVVLEGMAAGLPVVASRGGGPAEIITDGVDGLLYPPGDVAALADALRRLAADPALRARLARAALRRARDFSPEAICEQIMRAYAEALTASAKLGLTAR